MSRSEPSGGMPIQLDLRKQIDAICDRFELAWDEKNRPRIEEYLGLVPPVNRRLLLAELLASELSLRGRQAEVCDRTEYAERFPQDGDVVDDAFSLRRPGANRATPLTSQRFFEIITAFRARLRPTTPTTVVRDGDQSLRGLAASLARCTLHPLAETDVPPEERLWLRIIHACRRRNALDVDAVDAAVRDLLEPFPPPRRSILIDLLLGSGVDQTARAGGVTERTVTSTVLVAVKLLEPTS
ncbi:MAG TPA: hypothetical protein VMF30_04490 [Pirellulales bacterium]|nr:hypothetical protein [Pirellulales bacterium]